MGQTVSQPIAQANSRLLAGLVLVERIVDDEVARLPARERLEAALGPVLVTRLLGPRPRNDHR